MTEIIKQGSIKTWALDDRPREKLVNKGRQALSNAELLTILIGSGTTKLSALDIAKQVLSRVDDNLIELGKLSINDLMKFEGIGQAKAITIAAALDLGRRRREAEAIQKKKILSSKDAFEVLQSMISDYPHELFAIILLNRANHVIRKEIISEGGTDGTVVDPKKLFKLAIEGNASSIILGHNHPSGNVIPSESDKKLTHNLIEAGKVLQLPIIDHLIIGEEKYYSFADEGILF